MRYFMSKFMSSLYVWSCTGGTGGRAPRNACLETKKILATPTFL